MTAAPQQDTRFRLSEGQARALAEAYGTPLFVIDEANLRARARRYWAAFKAVWPKCELTYASKANSTLAVLAIAHQEGLFIDVASEGELRAAMRAGVPAAHCHVHGNNKTEGEIRFALEQGVGQLVIDNFGEIETLGKLGVRNAELGTKFVLRLAPGVDPATHKAISTGQADTKFGFNITDGSGEKALLRAVELGIPVIGVHCHVGSQLLDAEAQETGGALLARFAVGMKTKHGIELSYINVGGGLGVTYLDGQEPVSVEDYNRTVVTAIRKELEGSGLEPTLAQEPGRSMIAESGVTLYRAGVIKIVPVPGRGTRTYVAVDGGLSDNPRPTMYGAKYTVLRAARASSERGTRNAESDSELRTPHSALYTVSGKHCETDLLFEDVLLPENLAPGDLLQVLCTGAYNSSMASNYNRYQRPATALVRSDGSHVLVQRRETWDEMLAREILPPDLEHA